LLSDYDATPLKWLWEGRLALGKVFFLEGDAGIGKSIFTLALAAITTKGLTWPNGKRKALKGGVVILAAEDDESTIRLRLEMAGGDATKIALPTNHGKLLSLPEDMALLIQAIEQVKAKLVIFDPLATFMSAKDEPSARAFVTELQLLAGQMGCAMLVLRHLNAQGRARGFAVVTQVLRGGMLAAVDPDNTKRILVVTAKSNLAAPPEGLAYRLLDRRGVPELVWDGTTDKTHDQLRRSGGAQDERADALSWLKTILDENGGSIPVGALMRALKNSEHSMTMLRKIKKEAKVVSARITSEDGKRGEGFWVWKYAKLKLSDVPRTQVKKALEPDEPDEQDAWKKGTTKAIKVLGPEG
jgi:hypothetical protein